MVKSLRYRICKIIVCGIMMIGVAMLMFGCGKKPVVNQLGDDLTWTYNKSNKTLTISGQGEMPDNTWEEFKELSIKNLVIEEGVTSIAKSAFYCHSEITGKLVIPSSVQSIGEFAFYGCSGLTGDLIIPEGVTTISDYTFRCCEGFDGKLVIPSTVTSIGDEAFYTTSFTGELKLPEKLEHIGNSAFGKCVNFTGDLIIPESVTDIGTYAFTYCEGFDGKLKLPNGLSEIGYATFSLCGKFKGDLVIPDSVTSIAHDAFRSTGFDGSLILSSKLNDIGDYAFAGCGFIGKVSIPEQISVINSHTFDGCSGIEAVEFSDGLEGISSNAFYDCKSLQKVEFPVGVKVIGDMAFAYSGLTGHIDFTDGLCSIGDSCFRSCNKITGITLPETLLNIKDDAFANCEELSGDLVIPDNVAYVGNNAFYNCKKLSSVVFGEGISSIGPGAFKGCSNLKSARLGSSTPDYYSKDEDKPSFDDNTELIGFDEKKKGSILWNNYKESVLSKIPKTNDLDSSGEAKMMPYYWTDSLTRETFKGTGSYADTSIYFMDGMITASINGREFIKVPYEADPNEEEKRINVDNFVYLYGVLSDLEFYDNGYMKGVIKATLSLDDGTKEAVFFAVGSEETVLPVGYENIDDNYLCDDSYEESSEASEEDEEYEFMGKIDIEESADYYESWGEPYDDFYFMKYEDDRHEDSDGNPILWFGDLDKLAVGCSVYCAVENEELSATASSTLKSNGSISYAAENVCKQNNLGAWVEGSDGSGIDEYIEIKRKVDVSDKDYGIDYTEICIVNGYIKNEKVWKNNNRVKTLAFYYNDEYVSDIELEDTYSPQIISLDKYNIHANSGEEVAFKFVIKDVYKGDKYDDTAITGIVMDFYTPNH